MQENLQELQELVTTMSPEQLISPAGKELAHRLIQCRYEAWCRYRVAKIGREPAAHHLLIIRTVQSLLDGTLGKRKVMLLMPPGAAKSTYTTVLLPPWYVNPRRNPHDIMLACSYSYTLVEGFGREARDILEQEKEVLGVEPSKTAWASGDWRTTKNGGYWCAGVGSGIAGHRARIGFIDDYIGSEEEANSQVLRDKHWKWYWNDYKPRLWPDACELIIANRRHEDDLVGRLLDKKAADWLLIRLPMLAEDDDPLGRAPGERLWPEWFTEEQVQDAKVLSATWAGLYQQKPVPEDGDFFKREYIVEYRPDDLPRDLRIYVGADYALKTAAKNDYTCFVPAGMDTNGRLWILPDWFWKKVDTLEAVDTMLEMVRRRRPQVWWAGRENIVGSIEPFLNERMRQQNTFVTVEQLSESRDKRQKAQSIKARMSARTVMFPSYAPGYNDLVNQLMAFDNGTHDDFVDALAKLGQGLDMMVPARKRTFVDESLHLRPQPLTCSWAEKSTNARRKRALFAMRDN